MKILQLRWLALAGGCLSFLTGCADDPPPRPRPRPVVVYREPAPTVVVERPAPPPLIVETPPPQPRYAAVWVRGHYRWNGYRWVWVRGHYRPV